MGVQVINCGIIHRSAVCYDCGKEWQEFTDKNITSKIRYHVEKTGHEVGYEYGVAKKYKKD